MKAEQIKQFIDHKSGLDISEDIRTYEYRKLRWMYCYFCYRFSTDRINYSKIAKPIKMTHASVMHSLKKFRDNFETDCYYRKLVSLIEIDLINEFGVKIPSHISEIDDFDELKLKRKLKNLIIKNERLKSKLYNQIARNTTLKTRIEKMEICN